VRLASIVHALYVGGDPPPEARGFEAVMSGTRERLSDDDELLREMSTVLDSLYAHFQRETNGTTTSSKPGDGEAAGMGITRFREPEAER